MGMFSFLKSAGTKLFGASEEDLVVRREKIMDYVNSFDLKIKNFDVIVKSLSAICLKGECIDLAEKERTIIAAGNVENIEDVEDNLTITESSDAIHSTFYTVKSGDTLSAIAKTSYSNANKYNVIFEANKPMLSHPDKIYPGQKLIIPSI